MLPASLLLVGASPAPTAPDPRIDIRAVGDAAFVGDWSEFAEPKEEDPSKGDPKAENQPGLPKKRPGNQPPPRFFERRLAGMESLRSPHVNILNLEGSLTRTCTAFAEKEFNFATLPEVVVAYARWGFNVFGLANNHSVDCVKPNSRGEINAAIREVHKTYPEVLFHGVASSAGRLTQIAVKDIQGVRIGIISIKGWAMGARQNVGNLSNRKRIFAALRDAKVDTRILLLHGGVELSRNPDVPMIRVAREFLAEFGGDIVFGHHPHVMQGFEVLKKSNGRHGIIFYSLGNFLHDGLARGQDGMMAKVEVTKSGLKLDGVHVFPLSNASWRPAPIDPRAQGAAQKILKASNDFLESTLLRPDLTRVPFDLMSSADETPSDTKNQIPHFSIRLRPGLSREEASTK